jgi:uncharacterized membrane protein
VAYRSPSPILRNGAPAACVTAARPGSSAAMLAAGLLLGIGLGGFVDGIVLHQILQWHHMLTSEGSHPAGTVAGLEANTLADGLFHAFAWLAVCAGLWLLWRAGRLGGAVAPPGRRLIGLMLAGWGLFNLVEGLVDHQLLGIHHVKLDGNGDPVVALDVAFLALGALLLAAGSVLARSSRVYPVRGRASGWGDGG